MSFTPSGPGSYSATLTVSDDATDSPQTVALHGTAVPLAGGNTVTGHVYDGSRSGHSPVKGAGVSACHGAGSAMACREVSTGADGRYSLVAPAGAVSLTVSPPTVALLSGAADVTVTSSQPTVHDFTLSAPVGLSGGVSFEPSSGPTSGVPFVNSSQPFNLNVPVRVSRTGPAGQTVVHVQILGLGGTAASSYGQTFHLVELAYFAVHYDRKGVIDRLTRPGKGIVDCGRRGTSATCAQLAAFSGADDGAGTGAARDVRSTPRSSARPPPPRAAKSDCVSGNPQHKLDIATNNYGGVTVSINNPFGADTPPLSFTAPQIAIPSIPANGDLAHDLGWGAVTGLANFGINLLPPVALYNTIVGFGNAAVTLATDTNNNDLKNITRGGLVISLLAEVGNQVHGPVGWFAKGLSLIGSGGSALVGSLTAEGSNLDFTAASDCPSKHGSAYLDPSGVVRTTKGVPVAGATVTLGSASSAHGIRQAGAERQRRDVTGEPPQRRSDDAPRGLRLGHAPRLLQRQRPQIRLPGGARARHHAPPPGSSPSPHREPTWC